MKVSEPKEVRRALAGLNILEGDIVHRLAVCIGVPDVPEHLHTRWANVDLLGAHLQVPHERNSVAFREVARGKSWHRVSQDVRARQLQTVHGLSGDDQRLGGVEASGDANHQTLDARARQALLEAVNLNVVGFVAALVAVVGVLGHKRKALYRAQQPRGTVDVVKFERHDAHRAQALPMLACGVGKARQTHAVLS